MTDFRLKETFSFTGVEGPTLDMFVRPVGTIDDREELATAVRMALGTDSLADAQDILPDPDSTDRRGWWGDLDADVIWGGWPVGNKNWLLTRAKITDATSMEGSTVARAHQYTLDCLQPFIDNGMASAVAVQAVRLDNQTIRVDATVYRGPLPEISLRYQVLWEEPDIIEDQPIKQQIKTVRRIPYRNLGFSSVAPTVVKTG